MLTRFKKIYSIYNPGSAFRFSRGIAGGMAGTFFVLGEICKIPLKKFLFGYGPALTTFVFSTIVFAFKAKGNYQNSNPDKPSALLCKAEKAISTKLIIDKLQLDFNKTKNFLSDFNISKNDIKRLKDWEIESEDNLEDLLTTIYNTLEFDITKYPVSIISAIMLSAAHFMECLLLQVYVNFDIFDYTSGVTAANVAISIIALLAIIQGILEFIDVKNSFEHPSLATMSNTIFKAYNKYPLESSSDSEDNKNTAEQDEKSLSNNCNLPSGLQLS